MYLENNRYYSKFRRGAYMFPCDEQEKNRLDIFHKFFLIARQDQLHTAPLHPLPPGEKHLILDLGTGTGIWAIDMALRNENALVDGVDLVMIQPEKIYENQRFFIMDIESEWRDVRPAYHLIFARMLHGAIQNWQRVYHDVFAHLKPGGWFEQVEIDWTPHCRDGTLPQNSALEQWAFELTQAMNDANRPITADTPRTRAALAAAGFVDFNEQVIEIGFNGWPEGYAREMGRWFNLGIHEGLHALTIAPLTRMRGWTYQQAEELIARVKEEIRYRRHHAFCHLHVYTARRP
ncbi:methyltransferase LaeA [Thozetella sp. PMI_491]|nr:methyltransferase LaeA [Thozetella sp. PMI_491]